MSNKGKNIEREKEKDPLSLFDGASVSWDKSKEDVWQSMQESITETRQLSHVFLGSRLMQLAAAAVLIILLGVPSLMRFYTKTVEATKGEHLSLFLPDGSELNLNAESQVSYNPMWWRFKRDVKLDGEAFFKVISGSDFVVESDRASTEVVGTSFNILARDDRYEVSCITGKVLVRTADKSSEVFLEPNQKVVLATNGDLERKDAIAAERSIKWQDDEFFFTSVPIYQVFEEIERQFNITISSDLDKDLRYTGNFSRMQDVEIILELVCQPFGIKFESKTEDLYLIRTND